MQILNYRERFANNSSSSHSVMFLKDDISESLDKFSYPWVEESGDDLELNSYGWENFELNSPFSKAEYFAAQIAENLDNLFRDSVWGNAKNLALKETTGWSSSSYIDHQSVVAIPFEYYTPPLEYGSKRMRISEPFLRALEKAVINNPNCVVFGGNDNDYEEDNSPIGRELWLPGPGVWVCRPESEFVFTFFNVNHGGRATVNLAPWITFIPKKLNAPLLVDLKITDYCHHGCSFCYQGSTTGGKHAASQNVKQILSELSGMKVFEVAFGGGEPTSHPMFTNILTYCRDFGIQPNFTTFNLDFMEQPYLAKTVLDMKCSVAVSNPNLETLVKMRKYNELGFKFSAQYVSLLVRHNLVQKLSSCKELEIPVTILGYKQTGRGPEFASKVVSNQEKATRDFITHLLGLKGYSFAVDTALLQQMTPGELSRWDHRTLDKREGYQSWYIDAVASAHGPCSYTKKLIPLEYTKRYYNSDQAEFYDLKKQWVACPVIGE